MSGTVAGTTFTLGSEIGFIGAATSTSSCTGGTTGGGGGTCTTMSSGQAVAMILTNRADATCSLLQSETTNANFANFDVLQLAAFNNLGNVSPGTYPIVSLTSTAATGATAQFSATGSTCQETVPTFPATSGSVTVSTVSATRASGSYTVTFGTQGTFSGSFDFAACVLPDGGLPATTSTTCQP